MSVQILVGDCRELLRTLPDQSVNCCVTSPPYFGLRDYDVDGQIGLEPTPAAYVAELLDVFREVRRVLRNDGTLWLNLGDSYAGSWGAQSREQAGKHAPNISAISANQLRAARRKAYGTGSIPDGCGLKPKDLMGIPWRVAFALQDDGWWLRQDIIWSKPNPMPESVADRCTKSHEYLFLLSKSHQYHFDQDAISEGLQTDPKERYEERARVTGRGSQGAAAARGCDRDKSGGFPPRSRGVPPRHANYPESSDQSGLDGVGRGGRRNRRSVWTVAARPFKEAHFATFPPDLIEPCIMAGCPAGGVVLDPFGGAGTTGMVADRHGRDAILIELNPAYVAMATERLHRDAGMFAEVAA